MPSALQLSLISIIVFGVFGLSVWFYRRAARRPTGVEEHSLRLVGCLLMIFTGRLVLYVLVAWLSFASR